ncbi:isocitrate dehydrogenase [Candidatus Woesearchaeota archaeon CG10_big_fil_rev_8_21_14_0_10_34_8]|nr:MAG: isocitrate dehydrogenase [Candidatus Woesearchaeota archaeon CG10_big_fil_rev_8_21_14_0_10_34_8]
MTTKTYNICILPGDGIGPEVTEEAVKVLKELNINFNFIYGDIGFDAYQKLGTPLPEETLKKVREADATLFGAVTTPPNIPNYSSPILGLRQHFQLYANVRPCKSVPNPISKQGINILVVRENTEGLYSKSERLEDNGNRAITERIITRKGSERIIRYGYELARKQGRKKVTIVHKGNVLRETCGLFRKVALEIAEQYQDIETSEMLVDACAMQLIKKPEQFDVIITTNLFGDILSDEASMLVGGLGLACSGNIGEDTAVFEPVHGSAPKYVDTHKINPLATFLSARLMLEHLNLKEQAEILESVVIKAIKENKVTQDLGGSLSTQEVTENIINNIKNNQLELEE